MPKKKTYGFKEKKHVEDLIDMVGGGHGTYLEGRPRNGGTRIKHVKNGGSTIAAFNTGTNTMSSGTVTEYTCSSSGVLSSGSTFTAYNPGGQIAANAYGVVAMNEAGLWVWIVEKC